jgi:hypothetical protein
VKAAANDDRTHNPFDETHWVSRLRENLTSGSYGEGLETGRAWTQVPRQSFTRQTLFADLKSRGFNLEDTHLLPPERIAKLLAVLAIAFAFAHATGQWRAKFREIVIRAHTRRAQSIFRYGYDLLRQILLLDQPRAIRLWRSFLAGKSPKFAPQQQTPYPKTS